MTDDEKFLNRIGELETELARTRQTKSSSSILGHQLVTLLGVSIVTVPITAGFVATMVWAGASAWAISFFGWTVGLVTAGCTAWWRSEIQKQNERSNDRVSTTSR